MVSDVVRSLDHTLYMSLIDKTCDDYTKLSPEEQHHYARLMRDGDASAKQRLVESQYNLVKSIAFKEYNRWRNKIRTCDLEDLFQAGLIGLTHAVNRFDPDRGVTLTTYSTPWIHQTIRRCIYQNMGAVTLTHNVWESESLRHYRELHDTHFGMNHEEYHNRSVPSDEPDVLSRLEADRIVDSFNPRQQQIIRACIDGYTIREIAEQSGTTVQAVNKQLRLIRKSLRGD